MLQVRVRRLQTYKQGIYLMAERIDGKPTVREIAEASKGYIEYEIITFRGVEILITKDRLYGAIETTAEFTHDPRVEELAKEQEQEVEEIQIPDPRDGLLISNIWGVGCVIVGDRIGNLECTFSTNPDIGMAMQIPPEGSYTGPWEWTTKMLELCMDMGEIAVINPLIGRYYSFTYN